MTYPEQLAAFGLTIIGPFTTTKAKHTLQCDKCNNVWEATPISKVQAYKKYGTNGCPKCNLAKKSDIVGTKRDVARQKLTDKGFEVLSEWDGSQSTTYKILVRNIKCQHEFESAPGNLLHRDVQCPVCNLEVKADRCRANNQISRDEYFETADEWKKYKAEVNTATRLTYSQHKERINPLDLPRGLNGVESAHQLDHIVPIRWCFEHHVPVDTCAHVDNLQMLPWKQNSAMRARLKTRFEIPKIFHQYVTGIDLEKEMEAALATSINITI